MRTTVTIDEHLLAEARVQAARQHRTLGEIIDDALRVSLRRFDQPQRPVVLPIYGDPAVKPLVDMTYKQALAELLGDNVWPRRDDADS